jgi:signal transduction histidine kinase
MTIDTKYDDDIVRERRARLAAERKLEVKQEELVAANRKLSNHALSLSGKIVDQRKVVDDLVGQNSKVSDDLERANTKVVMVEQMLWDAIETIKDGFALFDADLKLIMANQPYLNSLNGGAISPGDSYLEILDLCLDEGLVDLKGQPEDEWYQFMLDRWQGNFIEPVTLQLWDKSYVKMTDRRTADGGIVSMALNITDMVLYEEELLKARDRAMAADRAKSAFLAKMSHELRTPMNGIVGMAELLGEKEQDDESALYCATIRSSGEALLEIINDVLDFSKIEAERVVLKA